MNPKEVSDCVDRGISLGTIKDSGERQEFSTGSVRDSEKGKGWYAHLSPIALRRLAQHVEAGGAKYGERNWEKGQPLTRYLESAVRHLYTYLEGHRDEDHLAAALWNVHCLIHTEEMILRGGLPQKLNNLPTYVCDPSLSGEVP